MKDYVYSFEKLEAWQSARNLVKAVYQITRKFPVHEKFGLCDQLQRSVVSVASNIAEGDSRIGNKEQSRFFEMAYSSLMETLNQCILAFDLGYLQENEFQELKGSILRLSLMINKIYQYRKRQSE